jgi:hypothetical protein
MTFPNIGVVVKLFCFGHGRAFAPDIQNWGGCLTATMAGTLGQGLNNSSQLIKSGFLLQPLALLRAD